MIVNSSKFNFKEIVDDLIMNGYFPEVVRVTSEVVPKVAQDAAKRLRATSPKSSGKNGGKYAKGWAVKREIGKYRVLATVYGKDGTYQLAHLLEHGHATRNGTGRVYPPTPAHPHIAEVEEWAINKAYDEIMHQLEGLP